MSNNSNPLFSINHADLTVGSLVRSTGAGSRIMQVVDITDNVATLRSYGHTVRGVWHPAKRFKTAKGPLAKCPKHGVYQYVATVPNYSFGPNSHNRYGYYHVVQNFKD